MPTHQKYGVLLILAGLIGPLAAFPFSAVRWQLEPAVMTHIFYGEIALVTRSETPEEQSARCQKEVERMERSYPTVGNPFQGLDNLLAGADCRKGGPHVVYVVELPYRWVFFMGMVGFFVGVTLVVLNRRH